MPEARSVTECKPGSWDGLLSGLLPVGRTKKSAKGSVSSLCSHSQATAAYCSYSTPPSSNNDRTHLPARKGDLICKSSHCSGEVAATVTSVLSREVENTEGAHPFSMWSFLPQHGPENAFHHIYRGIRKTDTVGQCTTALEIHTTSSFQPLWWRQQPQQILFSQILPDKKKGNFISR